MQTFKRFCRHDILFINEDITQTQLNQIETYADRLFKAVNIDINFTRHLIDRVNDKRNQKNMEDQHENFYEFFKRRKRNYSW